MQATKSDSEIGIDEMDRKNQIYTKNPIISKLVQMDQEMFPEPLKDTQNGERMKFKYGTAGFRTLGENLD